jgi:hypothetical protein
MAYHVFLRLSQKETENSTIKKFLSSEHFFPEAKFERGGEPTS